MTAVASAAVISQVEELAGQAPNYRATQVAVGVFMAACTLVSLLLLLWCLPVRLAWLSVGPDGVRRTFFPFRTTHKWRPGATLDVANLFRGETCQDAYLVWSNPGKKPEESYGLGSRWAFNLTRYTVTEQFGARLCELASEHGVTVTPRAVYRLCDPVGRLGATTKRNADTPMNDYHNPHRPAARQPDTNAG